MSLFYLIRIDIKKEKVIIVEKEQEQEQTRAKQ
jgi:hypothetical protein